ncbi:hypothetical protein KF728_27325 [Candidatus Obscuribacterales bacterium]|nr:hypothetical protein [Candidatus Obscuribacterales bacterium]
MKLIVTKKALLVLICAVLVDTVASTLHRSYGQTTKLGAQLRRAGLLNYEYDPGLILPLRNGTLLAFDGMHYKNEPERFVNAADGFTYGYGLGMIELFDPVKGQSKVLTQMPFVFERDFAEAANRRQMQAIELKDGRIFLVGMFQGNPTMKKSPLWRFTKKPLKLSVIAKSGAKEALQVVSPNFRQTMFGLIYDPKAQSFAAVDFPESIPPRWLVGMNLLPNGQVLITGGCVTRNLKNWRKFPEKRVLCFDPKTNRLEVVGELQHARFGHSVIPLGDSKFMLINGYGVSEREAKTNVCILRNPDGSPAASSPMILTHEIEVFDLRTKRSTVVGHTRTGRYDFAAMRLPNQSVFINGGAATSMLGFDASELYDSKTGRTSYVGELLSPRKIAIARHEELVPYRFPGEGIDFRALKSTIGPMIFAGRDIIYIYDWRKIANQEWLKTPSTPLHLLMPRIHHHIVENSSRRVFVMGGLTYSSVTGSSITRGHRADLIEEIVLLNSRGTN